MSEWQDIATAPKDGTRVRVSHALDPSSQKVNGIFETTGCFADGQWDCSAGFICIDNRLRWQPTHWQPLPSPPKAPVERVGG